MRLLQRTSIDVACNWKLLVESFLEAYHVRTIHRNSVAGILRPEHMLAVLHPYGHSSLLIPYRDEVIAAARTTDQSQPLPAMPGVSDF